MWILPTSFGPSVSQSRGADWAGWQSVYSPAAEDGYPAHIWDPVTGIIDQDVVRYWRDNYDLRYILVLASQNMLPVVILFDSREEDSCCVATRYQ